MSAVSATPTPPSDFSFPQSLASPRPFTSDFHRYFNGGPPAETDFGGDVSLGTPEFEGRGKLGIRTPESERGGGGDLDSWV